MINPARTPERLGRVDLPPPVAHRLGGRYLVHQAVGDRDRHDRVVGEACLGVK